MAKFINEVTDSISRARYLTTILLDLAVVPEGHPLVQRLHDAWISLEEVLLEIPRAGSNGDAVHDPGPAVLVRTKKDPLSWRTTSGGKVIDDVIPRSKKAKGVVEKSPQVSMPKWAMKRRVLSSSEFIRALGSTRAPRNRTTKELAKVGVEIIDESRLKCVACGRIWSQPLMADGQKKKGYWKCPDGCNE